jgi:ADP-ribose pyrophosphatase
MALPPLPGHRLELLDDARPPVEQRGFMYVRKLRMRVRFAEGDQSAPFAYDCADRSRMDAVVVVPHYLDAEGTRWVVLRSALRPPLAARPKEVWPVPEKESLGALWEVPAGLVEEDERSPEGLRGCAARELLEETGYHVDVARVLPLGPSTFPTPGVIGERHFYFHAVIDPTESITPPEDGSALEARAKLFALPLRDALAACRAGEIEDAKTELALRRLAEL